MKSEDRGTFGIAYSQFYFVKYCRLGDRSAIDDTITRRYGWELSVYLTLSLSLFLSLSLSFSFFLSLPLFLFFSFFFFSFLFSFFFSFLSFFLSFLIFLSYFLSFFLSFFLFYFVAGYISPLHIFFIAQFSTNIYISFSFSLYNFCFLKSALCFCVDKALPTSRWILFWKIETELLCPIPQL